MGTDSNIQMGSVATAYKTASPTVSSLLCLPQSSSAVPRSPELSGFVNQSR
ncbi:hypothetical protein ANO14919_054660 [Xylariales sp. No.14919]|nr:hypothetical protein ANO14919_054660 [Xylariales sp. No.14919]